MTATLEQLEQTAPPAASRSLYDRNFALALAVQSCFVVANTLMAHYARWIDFLGGSVSQVGWIMGAGAIAGLLLRPWMGQWINRWGSRRTWLAGLGIFSVAVLSNLLLVDLGPAIYLLRSCLVLGTALVFASSLTYVSQTAPGHRRTEAIGTLGAGGFIGMLIGPALGDLLLSTNRDRGDFGLVFWVAGIGCVVPAILLCFLRSPPPGDRHSPMRLIDFIRTTRMYWPGPILLVDLAFGMCMTVPFVFLATYIDQEGLKIAGLSVIGLFFWCYAGWGLTVRLTLRRWPDRIGRRKILLAGMLSMSLGMFCYGLVDPHVPWTIILPALVTGTGHGLMFHTMTSLTIESFPHAVRGTGSVLALMMLDIGTIAGAPLLGQIAEHFGFDWMFFTIGFLSLTVACGYGWSSIPVWRQRKIDRLAELEGRAA